MYENKHSIQDSSAVVSPCIQSESPVHRLCILVATMGCEGILIFIIDKSTNKRTMLVTETPYICSAALSTMLYDAAVVHALSYMWYLCAVRCHSQFQLYVFCPASSSNSTTVAIDTCIRPVSFENADIIR
jgi:hypothetical protein